MRRTDGIAAWADARWKWFHFQRRRVPIRVNPVSARNGRGRKLSVRGRAALVYRSDADGTRPALSPCQFPDCIYSFPGRRSSESTEQTRHLPQETTDYMKPEALTSYRSQPALAGRNPHIAVNFLSRSSPAVFFATPRFGVIPTTSVRSLSALQGRQPSGWRLQPYSE